MPSAPAVEVRDLVVRYGDKLAVDGVSFTAAAGSVLALLGPNGAGKTSTLEALEGYRSPFSGCVRVLGLDPVADRDALVPRIGVMLQRGGVYSTLGAEAVLRLFAGYYDEPANVEDLLDRLDLRGCARTPWRRLSGGEQQRVSLALALVGRPEVAFLDEPSAGVDPAGRRVLWDVLRELRDAGVTVVLTTHHLEEAEKLADEVVIVDAGRVVASGTPADLRGAGGGQEVRFAAPAGLDVAALGAHLGAPVVEDHAGEYVAAVPSTPANIAALTAWLAEHDVALGDLRAGRRTLEDVFLALTSQESAAVAARAPRGGRGSRR